MKSISLQQTADFLEGATIERTLDAGDTIIHSGIGASGFRFILMNDCMGETVLGEFA